METIFEENRNCWKIAQASRTAVLIDAENYFRAVRQSMKKAEKRIMLLGWDFDARIKMYDTRCDLEGPLEIGEYINWLLSRNEDLHIYILRWDTGAIKSLFRGKTLLTMLRWFFHPRVHLKLDSHHPPGAAQHQKVITIDRDTAFCGGIDITDNRWDTRSHLPHQPEREQPDGKDAGPWHDAAMVLQGEAAAALADFSEGRWREAGGKPIVAGESQADCWPANLAADFTNIPMALSRTRPEMDDQAGVFEIEQLYCDLIASADHYIYAESQYFASRKIAAAMAERLREEDGPEIVIINPVGSEGWLEPEIMDTTRAQLFKALQQRDRYDRFRIFHPLNVSGNPIYVHAKVVIVDDRLIRIGSSNLNNRSMGFDTECDVTIDAGAESDPAWAKKISDIRNDLIAEHLHAEVTEVARQMEETGSLIQTIQNLQGSGRTVEAYQVPNLNAVEEWLADNDILDPNRSDDDFARMG